MREFRFIYEAGAIIEIIGGIKLAWFWHDHRLECGVDPFPIAARIVVGAANVAPSRMIAAVSDAFVATHMAVWR